jgi:putative endonuclease|tara:strand:+ start:406 stop:663 length:258 start_codon:yes stop_codon:yes gene_type:complete
MKYYVYLLVCNNKNNLISYVGYTNNLKKRILLHNSSKGAKFTKGRKWIIAYKKMYKTKSIALKEEFKLKHDQKKRKLIKSNFLTK